MDSLEDQEARYKIIQLLIENTQTYQNSGAEVLIKDAILIQNFILLGRSHSQHSDTQDKV